MSSVILGALLTHSLLADVQGARVTALVRDTSTTRAQGPLFEMSSERKEITLDAFSEAKSGLYLTINFLGDLIQATYQGDSDWFSGALGHEEQVANAKQAIKDYLSLDITTSEGLANVSTHLMPLLGQLKRLIFENGNVVFTDVYPDDQRKEGIGCSFSSVAYVSSYTQGDHDPDRTTPDWMMTEVATRNDEVINVPGTTKGVEDRLYNTMMCWPNQKWRDTSRSEDECKRVIRLCDGFFGSHETLAARFTSLFSKNTKVKISSRTRLYRAHVIIHEALHHLQLLDVCAKPHKYKESRIWMQECKWYYDGVAYEPDATKELAKKHGYTVARENADSVAQVVTAVWKRFLEDSR